MVQFSRSLARDSLELESIVGRLSPVQKMLLGTDESVTNLLEVVAESPIEIETLVQKVVPVDEAVARELQVNPGDKVNFRVVLLKNTNSQKASVYAISHTPLKKLDTSFKDDLTKADIPNRSHPEKAQHRITARHNKCRIFACWPGALPDLWRLSSRDYAHERLQDNSPWPAANSHQRDVFLQQFPK